MRRGACVGECVLWIAKYMKSRLALLLLLLLLAVVVFAKASMIETASSVKV
jgi:hypothetical protein